MQEFSFIEAFLAWPGVAWRLQTFYLSQGVSLWNDTTNKNLELTSFDNFINFDFEIEMYMLHFMQAYCLQN